VQEAPVIGDVPSRLRGLRVGIPRTAIRGVSRGTWLRIGILVLFCAFYVWTASSSVPIRFTSGADGLYGRMADAFLHGRLSLADAPDSLVNLGNPYDPAENQIGTGSLHDLSLYDGKLYAYWGPAPAVLLFLPARLLGFAFSQTLAIALFATLALLFSTLLLLSVQRRFAPHAATWKVNASIVLLGFANVLPYTIRRPDKYEVAISAGLCFAMLGAWLLLGALLRQDGERPSARRLALGSLALGLAVASRPSHVLTAAGLIALSAWLLRGAPRERRRALAAALLAPIAVVGAFLAAYNDARFGSITEFGLSYQLAGVDVTARDAFSLSYLPPGLWYYLAAPPRLSVLFPFVLLPPPPAYPGHVPPLYDGVEPTGGIFVLAPLLLILLAVPFRRRIDPDLRAVLATFVLIAIGLVVVAAIAFWGATMRYEVDFASFLLIPALVVWLRARRRWVTILGVAAIVWGSMIGLALSFSGQNQPLRGTHPKLWDALTRDFSPVSRAATWVTSGGPTIGEVAAIGAQRGDRSYTTFDDQGIDVLMFPNPIGVKIVMPSAGDVHLKATAIRGSDVPARSRLNLLIRLPDGRVGSEPLPKATNELDVTFRLRRGVQQVLLLAKPSAQPTKPILLILKDLRVE